MMMQNCHHMDTRTGRAADPGLRLRDPVANRSPTSTQYRTAASCRAASFSHVGKTARQRWLKGGPVARMAMPKLSRERAVNINRQEARTNALLSFVRARECSLEADDGCRK